MCFERKGLGFAKATRQQAVELGLFRVVSSETYGWRFRTGEGEGDVPGRKDEVGGLSGCSSG